MTTQTTDLTVGIKRTVKVKVTDLCEDYKIPFFYCRIRKTETGKKGVDGLPKGYQQMTYDEAMKHNENRLKSHLHICCVLKNGEDATRLMVVDFDDKNNLIDRYAKYGGENWISKSSTKKMPHLWRERKPDDNSKNLTKVGGEEIDFCYDQIFEHSDSMVSYDSDTLIPVFDFQTCHPKAITLNQSAEEFIKKAVQDTPVLVPDRFMEHLRNITEDYVDDYTHWFKICMAIKGTFIDGQQDWFEIIKAWSLKSSRHQAEDTEPWENKFAGDPGTGSGTILYYSKLANEADYYQIEKKYRDKSYEEVKEEARRLVKQQGQLLLELDAPEQTPERYPTYEMVKAKFEEHHFIIKNQSCVGAVYENKIEYYTPEKFRFSNKAVKYYTHEYKDGKFVKMKANEFVVDWYDDEERKEYHAIACCPPPIICPDDKLNSWRPFKIETVEADYIHDAEGLELFKEHILVLCGRQTEIASFFMDWIAQMFQYPAIKTILITLISEEGAGKGTLIMLLRNLMGKSKVLETPSPSEHVWGKFNNLMTTAFLVNLNEMSKSETLGAQGKMKTLVTDLMIQINNKGVSAYDIESYHRFIATTNEEDPMTTKRGDRRNLIIQASSEWIGNKPLFEKLNQKYNDINTLKTIYAYLMSLDVANFHHRPIPVTEYQEEMKQASRCHYETWLENYTRENVNYEGEPIDIKADMLYKLFSDYIVKNGIKFETNSIKLGLAMSRLSRKIPGITKQSGSKPYTILNIERLKKYFLIGCQVAP